MTSVVIGTAGHIDHGKSALVRALTGIDPDRLKEEKARGITIDLGFAHTAIGALNLAFVDVPGHERFVKNMLAGAGGIDLVLLVIAADEGVMPQTREHFEICRLLRVRAGVVALTKADLVDAEGLELARQDVRDLIAGTFLDAAPIVAVSSKTLSGLEMLRAALIDAAGHVPGRAVGGVARLPVDRAFSMKGFGTVVTGTLVSGSVGVETELELIPRGRRVIVRGVQVHGASRPDARAGERVALNLAGVAVEDVERGQTLTTPGSLHATLVADAAIELLAEAPPLKHGARIRVHQGTAEVLARVAVIGPAAPDRPAVVAPGSRGFVRIRFERPVAITRSDRYIMRTYSPPTTIAGGHILDPRPPRTAVRSEAAAHRCRILSGGVEGGLDVDAAGTFVQEAGAAGLPVAALVWRAGLEPGAASALANRLVSERACVRVDEMLVAHAALAGLKRALTDAVAQHHKDEPLSDGLPREEARTRLLPRGYVGLFERAVTELRSDGILDGHERLRLARHEVVLSPAEARAQDAIERALRAGGLAPPALADVAAAAAIPMSVADRVVKLLQRQKTIVKVDALLFHEEALVQLKQLVGSMKTGKPAGATIDVATFKERFGVSRKYAIPLLEYLDRERVTRRVGASRVIL